MNPQFTQSRSDAIRAALIEHVAIDLHPQAASASSASRDHPRPARSRRAVHLMRPGQLVAGVTALALVALVTSVAVSVALNVAHPVATAPSPVAMYVGSGTVIERDGEAHLCLEGQEQSIPPGCAGAIAVLEGWRWDRIPYREASGVRFTETPVTVRGTLWAEGAAAGSPILILAEPAVTGATSRPDATERVPTPSGLSDPELEQIISGELAQTVGPGTLSIVDGVIEARVAYDDGALQAALDEEYGAGVVLVVPLLRRE